MTDFRNYKTCQYASHWTLFFDASIHFLYEIKCKGFYISQAIGSFDPKKISRLLEFLVRQWKKKCDKSSSCYKRDRSIHRPLRRREKIDEILVLRLVFWEMMLCDKFWATIFVLKLAGRFVKKARFVNDANTSPLTVIAIVRLRAKSLHHFIHGYLSVLSFIGREWYSYLSKNLVIWNLLYEHIPITSDGLYNFL